MRAGRPSHAMQKREGGIGWEFWRRGGDRGARRKGIGIELVVCQELADLGGGLLRDVAAGAGGGGEGVGAMVEHEMGVVVSMGGSLDAKVAKHGDGLPAAQELDGVQVNPGAEGGGRTIGSERVGREEGGRDAGDWI